MMRIALSLVAMFATGSASAHAGHSPADWWLWLVLLAGAPLYAFGAGRLWRHARIGRRLVARRALAAGLGWLALIGALAPPLDALAQVSFAAHMVQHEILMLVAAPLLVLARPLAAFMWALPLAGRQAVARPFRGAWWRQAWGWLVAPLTAWSVHTVVLWTWHAPAWFEAGLQHRGIHDLQHASFFIAALLFWWALARRRSDGVGLLYVLTTLLHTGVLGALLTFSPRVWYPTYLHTVHPFGLTPLADQQLGGLIMWVPAGAIFIVAGLVLVEQWMRALEPRSPHSPRTGAS